MAKKIDVYTEYGGWLEATWYDDSDGSIYASGTRIGTAKTAKEAIAIVEVYAERVKGSRVKRVDIS